MDTGWWERGADSANRNPGMRAHLSFPKVGTSHAPASQSQTLSSKLRDARRALRDQLKSVGRLQKREMKEVMVDKMMTIVLMSDDGAVADGRDARR